MPRDQVVAFALYTHDRGVLKLSAQLYPLKPEETKTVRLEFMRDGKWTEVERKEVIPIGWSAHFRFDKWDNTKDVQYRVLARVKRASFEGLIRRDPIEKEVIVVGNLSCNSSRTPGPRPTMVENLKKLDPDLLFFAGDQSYPPSRAHIRLDRMGNPISRRAERSTCWHDPRRSRRWPSQYLGENGKKATNSRGPSGGYFFHEDYVNMVQRCQTWHLPDAYGR